MLLAAQALLVVVEEGGAGISSDALIAFILGGSILTTIIGAYRFIVNMRTTERGMARDRVVRANEDAIRERRARVSAQREADAWQAYCGDLTYALRVAGVPVPSMPRDLRAFVNAEPRSEPPEDLDASLRALHESITEISSGKGDEEEQGPSS